MHEIINYFETIPSLHRAIILASGIAFFWLLENSSPLFKFNYKKWKHAWPNIFFTLTTIVVNFLMAFILLRSSDWVVQSQFGLLQWLNLSLWLDILLGILFLDLISAYFAHFVLHKVRFLWMFHLIHHTDGHVDTTSANRHHPGESVIRFVFTTLAVIILGAPIGIVMLYQSLSVVLSQLTHANISLPTSIEKIAKWVIVTPDMHKVHHHNALPYTDSNYGNIFSIWDRIFGTFLKLEPKDIVYGVDSYPEINDETKIAKLLILPFTSYRPPTGSKGDS